MRIFRKTMLFIASSMLLMLGVGCGKKKDDTKKIELQQQIDSLRESLEVVEEVYGPPEMIEEYNQRQTEEQSETEDEIELLENDFEELE